MRVWRGESQAVLMVVGGALSLQFGAAFAVILLRQIGPIGAVTLRLVLAAILIGAIARPRLRGHRRSDLLIGLAFGIVLAAMNLSFYQAAARLPLGAAVTLEFLGPLSVAIITSRRPRDVLWVMLAGTGVWLLSEGGLERLDPTGVGFALGAAVCWASYIVLGSRASRRFPGTQALAIALIVGSLGALPLAAATVQPEQLTPRILLLGLVVAVMSSALPYSLELGAMRRIPPGTFGVLMSLEPAIAALAGYLILTQRLTPWQLLAIALVVVASAGATHAAARRH